jgi:hypothetical protein
VAPKAWETIYCHREPTPFEYAYRHLDFSKELFEFDVENEDTGPFKEVTAEWADGEEKEIEKPTSLPLSIFQRDPTLCRNIWQAP